MRTLIAIVVVVLLIVIAIGISRDWFTFHSRENPNDDKVTFGVDLDKAKFHADTRAAQQKLQEDKEAAEKKAKELAAKADEQTTTEKTISGTIAKIDAADNRLAVTATDNKELNIFVDSSTKIRRKNEVLQLNDLRAGNEITAAYMAKDGKNLAKSITVESATP